MDDKVKFPSLSSRRQVLLAMVGVPMTMILAACSGGSAQPTSSAAQTSAAPVKAASAANQAPSPASAKSASSVTQATAVPAPKATTSASTSQPVDMTFWTHQYKPLNDLVNTFITGFEKEHPNVKITYTYEVDKDYESKMMATLQAGGGPDALLVFPAAGMSLPANGVLVPVDYSPWGGEDKWVSLWVPEIRKQVQVNGKDYYGIITADPGSTVIVNTVLADSKKIDWKAAQKSPITWDDLATWARELTKMQNGRIVRDGYMITNSYGSARLYQMYQPLLIQHGGRMTNLEGTKCTVNSDAGIVSLQWHNDMVNKWHASLVRRETVSPSAELPHENTAMGLLGFWVYPTFYDDNKQLAPHLNAIVLPQVKGGTPYYFGGSTPSGYGVPRFSKIQEWGWSFLEYMSRFPNQWLAGPGTVLAVKGWADLPAMSKIQDAPVWKYVGARAKGIYQAPNELLHLSEIEDAFQRAWERTILNHVPAKQSLDQMAQEVDGYLKEKS